MDDIWIISWFNHTAFDANPIWKSPINAGPLIRTSTTPRAQQSPAAVCSPPSHTSRADTVYSNNSVCYFSCVFLCVQA